MKLGLPFSLALLMTAVGSVPAHAALAWDNAAQGAYSDGWAGGDNGGSEFGAWTLSGTGSYGFFVGTSANNGDGGGNIDTSGKSWGLWANSGGLAQAVRAFNSVLAVGQTFSIGMDNGWVQDGGSVGFALRNASGQERFRFYFSGGDTVYRINDSTTGDSTTIGFTDDGLSIAFTLTAADAYSVAITAGGGSPVTITGTLGASGSIADLRLFNSNAGPNYQRDLFFNSLQVVPEPTHAALGVFGVLFGAAQLWRWARRRAQTAV